ncbi:ImmA/IrrE family metallo-endopeptidase [Cytobacillus gottheilii]|uniref:ImmA/IrrE family metallo-endopeptidase n=1 Tax=Cytobacillus gottheilii TaxID=859144 RepID=UPI003CFA103E
MIFNKYPEEKIALRFAMRHNLVPPVNVMSLLEKYADIEEDSLPNDVDGICLEREGTKPLVIVDRFKPVKRKRFTLAHELGHIIIPWHSGTMICHTNKEVSIYENYLYAMFEQQANRFASEILIPTSWLKNMISSIKFKEQLIRTVIDIADVSLSAALIAIYKNLTPGNILLVTLNGVVQLKLTSPGTKYNIGKDLDILQLNSVSDINEKFQVGSYKVYCWEFSNSITPIINSNGKRELAKVILKRILESIERQDKLQSINGIIGAMNGTNKTSTKEELYSLLKQRIASDESLESFFKHPEFEYFLQCRVAELRK